MATTEKRNPWFISSSSQVPPPVRVYPWGSLEGALKPGAALAINSDGKINSVANEGASILGYLLGLVDTTKTWPIVSLSTGTEVRVSIVRPGDLYGIFADFSGDDVALTQAHVGDSYGIRKQTGGTSGKLGYYTMCTTCTDPTMFTIVDIIFNIEGSRFALADNPGAAIVKHTGVLQG